MVIYRFSGGNGMQQAVSTLTNGPDMIRVVSAVFLLLTLAACAEQYMQEPAYGRPYSSHEANEGYEEANEYGGW